MICYLLFLFSFLTTSCSFALEIKFHTLNITQHLLLPSCINSSTATFNSKDDSTTLEVVHRQGLCDYQTQNHPDATSLAEEILRMDQLRVKFIHHKNNTSATKLHNHADTHHDDIPVQPGRAFSTVNYIVRIGLGTPANNLHMVFDTGSDVTWTQCQPCLKHCYKQQDPIFEPRNSASYSNISCSAPDCRPKTQFGCYHGATCVYDVEYGDESYTQGFLAKDKLTVTGNDVFHEFIFGCGQNNQGHFGTAAGILGLSRGKLSFVSQTSKKYAQYFSYRLPPNIHSKGHLTLGKNSLNSKDVKFTPLIDVPKYPYYYCIQIISITVGKTLLPVGPSVCKRANAVIDSGTVVTWLPRKAYITMRDEFKRQMNTKLYPPAPAFDILDTCYNVPKHTFDFPPVSFTFGGNVKIDLDRSGIVYVINSSLVCLAFTGNTDPKDDFTIYGNTQQKNMEVVYDVAGGKLGFRK